MSQPQEFTRNETNRQCLMDAIRVIGEDLKRSGGRSLKTDSSGNSSGERTAEPGKPEEFIPSPPALDRLASLFGLTSFERKILLLGAGVALDPGFAALLQDITEGVHPFPLTFSLPLAAFQDAHWSALSPARPLRYWRMVECGRRRLFADDPFSIDEQIVHFLTGLTYFDERLAGIAEPVSPGRWVTPSRAALSERIVQSLTLQPEDHTLPMIRFTGNERDKTSVAADVTEKLGRRLFRVFPHSLPSDPNELTTFVRLWDREAALNGYALFLDCSDLDLADKFRLSLIRRFVDATTGVFFLNPGPWLPDFNRKSVVVEVVKPDRHEQSLLWKNVLGEKACWFNGTVETLVSQFDLDASAIQGISRDYLFGLPGNMENRDQGTDAGHLWKSCCHYNNLGYGDLAQRIEPAATWNDIVLPGQQLEILHEIAMQVRQRKTVYEKWGFGTAATRGLGITALFSGESGTGKTMAAEVLANELHLDLCRVDLSQVVNKYVGETEKNLKRIFDAAEQGGVILLFDEADALFGKRSEVKDSHDRYGNIEVSYLLQRMEAFRGLAILTTNMKNALDKAFLRRIRFVVQFPFPGAAHRAEIWKKVFPSLTPLSPLDYEKLARLSIPGGNIRNIALNAAFIAADAGSHVGMTHIFRAVKTELSKMEKTTNLVESDFL